ncbi:transcriptional activator of glycolytic enzymes-domain-containing protein [Sphaerosporella brunnea]|uniref:Transcriptional activator of glycolytic enzymes-domain-containing protein n=1 Tax=Sphaerosporella brunnea TaxID=1250544 RepID=A0A5J5EQH1_9PEZI|nr:transcriptional activator of glycolytic enzymes-domain-containing protein [Sphaerosporella brunnea]
MGAGGQQKATGGAGGNTVKQHQAYMRSPSTSHASLHNTSVNLVGNGTPAAMVGRSSVSASHAPTPSPGSGDVKPFVPIEEGPATVRVREEGGTETFALPLGMVNTWESFVHMIQATFSKTGDPRLTNSRGDTIPRMSLPGFMVDGMLFIVSFPNHNPHGGTHVSNRTIQQPSAQPSKSNVPPDPAPAVNGIPTSNYSGLANTAPNNPPPYSPPPAHATPPVNQYAPSNGNAAVTAGGGGNTPSSTSSSVSPRGDHQEYKLSRSIKTVNELWQEWTKGLAPDQPSVVYLESTYGPKWRSTQAERKFYSRRKVIIEEVRKLIDQGRTEWDAISDVDEWRGGRSLDKLSKTIVEKRKATGGGGGDDRTDYDGHDGRRESRAAPGGRPRQLQQQQEQQHQQVHAQQQQQHTGIGGWA